MLPWDHWGVARALRPGATLDAATSARLDALAALVPGVDPDWAFLREAYDRDDGLRVPGVVLAFPNGVPTEVAVALPLAGPAHPGSHERRSRRNHARAAARTRRTG